MSASAQRLVSTTDAPRMRWQRPEMIARNPRAPAVAFVQAPVVEMPAAPRAGDLRDVLTPPPLADRVVAAERDAYARGFAEGQRAGEAAAADRAAAIVRRLTSTVDAVGQLRTTVMRRAEHDLVKLALAMAERIIRREVEADRELLVAMARVAIDKLGDNVTATIHLNPADYAATASGREPRTDAASVDVVADPQVPPGGCLVRSSFGVIDAGLDTQIRELTDAMIGDLAPQVPGGDLPHD